MNGRLEDQPVPLLARTGQAGFDDASNEAVTTVLIPPRTVKSPVTVIRRG